jgi:hypothetical protein
VLERVVFGLGRTRALSQPGQETRYQAQTNSNRRHDKGLARSQRTGLSGDCNRVNVVSELLHHISVGLLLLFQLGDSCSERLEIRGGGVVGGPAARAREERIRCL